jgi:uncharacterized protein (TIGR03032 family)
VLIGFVSWARFAHRNEGSFAIGFEYQGNSRMSALIDAPARPSVQSAAPPAPVAFNYTQTDSFVALLQQLRATLLVSTYQANKLLVVRASEKGLSTLVRTFDKPMGMAVSARQLAIGTRKEVWFLRDAPDIAPRIEPPGQHDACFLPRSSHVTGDVGIHEVAWADDALWIVCTRFSCLATLSPDYSFVPRWRPPMISALAPEDRCHLNGLALVDGQPRYVTALGTTDDRDGWRADKPDGGCIIDIPSGEFVARGLSMPHSPRWHQGKLWVLESGIGGVALVDRKTGQRETVETLPGFTRGLAVAGPYAFVGLSKIRPTSAMDGVPLAEKSDQLQCGIAVLDLRVGQIVATLQFQTAVEEIFDVQLLTGIRFPELVGFHKGTLHHAFVIPPA